MRTNVVLDMNGKRIEINKRSTDVYWRDSVYVRIIEYGNSCYLELSEVQRILDEMFEMKNET